MKKILVLNLFTFYFGWRVTGFVSGSNLCFFVDDVIPLISAQQYNVFKKIILKKSLFFLLSS